MRPSNIVYDRAGSSIACAQAELFDFDAIFADADWFHFTGITPAPVSYTHLSAPEILQPLLKRMTFVKRTERTITDLDRLMQELMQVREQGYALDARCV